MDAGRQFYWIVYAQEHKRHGCYEGSTSCIYCTCSLFQSLYYCWPLIEVLQLFPPSKTTTRKKKKKNKFNIFLFINKSHENTKTNNELSRKRFCLRLLFPKPDKSHSTIVSFRKKNCLEKKIKIDAACFGSTHSSSFSISAPALPAMLGVLLVAANLASHSQISFILRRAKYGRIVASISEKGRPVLKCLKPAIFLMTALVSKRSLIVCKLMRKWPYFLLDLLPL